MYFATERPVTAPGGLEQIERPSYGQQRGVAEERPCELLLRNGERGIGFLARSKIVQFA